jgi:murein DD-endopeptidase MepM/ murein hydrolase activator NlpD
MLMWRRLLPLIATVCLMGCKDRQMSAACRAILEQPPPPVWALENNSTVNRSGQREWVIRKFNPGIAPILLDVRSDSTGFATAPWVGIEPGRRELIFAGTTDASVTALPIAVPRMMFVRNLPAAGRDRPPIVLRFPIDPEIATISQSPREGVGLLRGQRSHTAALGGQFEAIDIDAPVGTPILAPADGLVVHGFDENPDVPCDFATHMGYGNTMMLVTEDDVTLQFGHLQQDSIRVEVGTQVRRGDPIAAVGHSGSGDRAHLHFVAMALGPNGVDSMPIRFEPCGDASEVWEPRNGSPCRASD